MKRLILVSAMILGLAATGAMASQNKNTKGASKPAATGTGGGTMSKGSGKHHKRRHHRRRHHKGSASTGNMASKTPKSKNTK